MKKRQSYLYRLVLRLSFAVLARTTWAQLPPGRGESRGPALVSPEVLRDARVVFRIAAPRAESVRLDAGDIPGLGAVRFSKSYNGIWDATDPPVRLGFSAKPTFRAASYRPLANDRGRRGSAPITRSLPLAFSGMVMPCCVSA